MLLGKRGHTQYTNGCLEASWQGRNFSLSLAHNCMMFDLAAGTRKSTQISPLNNAKNW